MNAFPVLTNNTWRDILKVCTFSKEKFLPDIYTENTGLICSKLVKSQYVVVWLVQTDSCP